LKRNKLPIRGTLIFVLMLIVFSGCEKPSKKQANVDIANLTFRNIPGITQDEINAIEALKEKYSSFVFGVNPTTEAFRGKSGDIKGYSVLFCNWLTRMFEIPFKPKYYQWNELLDGLESGEVDFTGELMSSYEGRADYFRTGSTISRLIKYYWIKGNPPLTEIIKTRRPRYAFLVGSVVIPDTKANAGYEFETITVDNHQAAYQLLKSGKADAFFGLNTSEGAFDEYGDVEGKEFFPLVSKSSCLTVKKEELLPIISVMEKARNKDVLEYMTGLQKRGYQQYLVNKMQSLLTEEERLYIAEHPLIPVATEFNNYPISFYDTRTNKWEGIFFDTLNEITNLTGLVFEIQNEHDTQTYELNAMLENGNALMLSELFHSKETEGNFLWAETPILTDNYAFLTKSDFHNIDIGEVSFLRVALRGKSHYADLFKKMFPDHRNYTEYETQEEVWDALREGEVDTIFASRRRLVIYTNYREEAGFKLNLLFDYEFNSSIGFNKNAAVLKSIVDKAIRLININNISNQWMNRTYDYRVKSVTAQRSWFIGMSIMIFLMLSLVSILLIRSRNAGRQLENMVKQRTSDLAFETSKLKAIINSIPDSLFCKDKDFRYIQCNKSYEELIGRREADILGMTNQEGAWFSHNESEMINKTELTVMNEDRTIAYEQRITAPSTGKMSYYETVKAPIIQDGVVTGLITIVRDISQRKALEREIAYQTTMLKTMIDSLPDAVFCKDLEFKYTLCNNYMANMFGKHPDDVLGKDDQYVLDCSKEQAAIINEIDNKVIKEERRIAFEEWLYCADGVKRLFETVKSPLILYGEIIGIMGVGRDITQRKVMEDEIAFKTAKLQMIVDTIPDILFCKDTDLRYTQCNKPFELFWGVNEAATLDLTDEDISLFPSEFIKTMHNTELEVMNENKIVTNESTIVAALTGKEAVFESTIAPLKQGGNVVGIMCIARDVTQRKLMEEAIQAASQAKTSFLANMSHEIRTPLNVVIGLTNLILEDEHLDDHVAVNLAKISSAGTTLLSIVNDILDFSKIESGKLEITPVDYYMPSLLNDIITLVITRLGEKPIKFYLDIRDDLPANLHGDDLRVKQIFTNMLTNAIKYTRQGSIELTVRSTRDNDSVWMDVTVKDSGIGIRKEDIDKLFSDYNQVDTKANRSIEGTGLGLAITKRLIELMDGEIRVESVYGNGSTFHMHFRQGYVNDVTIGSDTASKLRCFCYADEKRDVTKKFVRLNLSYAKVLVVDDMQTNLDVATGILRGYKMQVDCLDNGHDTVERIRAGTPVYNAIFMDHMMPGMDGIETVDKIRALGTEYAKNLTIIALTANAIHGTDKMFFEHGFQAFITKPIDVIEMDNIVRKWVRDPNRDEVPVPDESFASGVSSENIVIEIPGVDTKKGLNLYVGDTKVYIPLLRSYVTNTPKLLDKLRDVTEENLSSYVINIHGLKGTSAGIGAEAIREAALKLETISRAGDLKGVLARNGKLIKDTEVIVANVKAWLEQHDANSGEKKPRLKAPDKELLARLRRSCESYDVDDIDKTMLELESADYEEGADLVTWLRQKIDVSKMGEVAKRLAELDQS